MSKIKIIEKDDHIPQIINELIENRDSIRELATVYVTKKGKLHVRYSYGLDRYNRIGMLTDLAHELSHG